MTAARQLNLYTDPATLARSTDPESSHEAARRVVRNGACATQKADVLAALKRFGKSTSRALAAKAGLDRHMVARRLPGLESDGLVRRTERLLCPEGKTMAEGWVAV